LTRRTLFQSNLFKKLSSSQRFSLDSDFTDIEIKMAVWDCDGDKAQGPDGFSFSLIKKFWSILGHTIFVVVKELCTSGKLVKGSNSSFLALLPKVIDPLYFSDYRPIGLIGSLYKIIAKLMSNRLKMVINSVIGDEQSA